MRDWPCAYHRAGHTIIPVGRLVRSRRDHHFAPPGDATARPRRSTRAAGDREQHAITPRHGSRGCAMLPGMSNLPHFAPRRALGRTGFRATVLGIGDLADRSLPLATCVATVRRAIDAGLNVIDTAPGYEDGYSEQIVGQAVKGVRDDLFVIDKIDQLAAPVSPQIDASLRRLQLDATDAFVFHGLSSLEQFERLRAPGGGFDQLAECIRAGKTRFGGISSHHPDVLQAAMAAGLCDIVMFAVGPFVGALPLTC